MGFTNTLIAISFFTLLLNYNINVVQSQEPTTTFTFDSFQSQPGDDLIYQGDVHVPPSSTFLRLIETDDVTGVPLKNRTGRVMYSAPIYLWEPYVSHASFETTIRFTITPTDGAQRPAEGLAFFLATVGSQIPKDSYGPNLGLFAQHSGAMGGVFAVEFDINPSNSPWEQWDPTYPHIGVDYTSRRSTNVTAFENAMGQIVTARINYEANTRMVTVFATAGTQTFSLSYKYDLRRIMHDKVQVGISASTGDGVAQFEIHSWYFTSTLLSDTSPPIGFSDNIMSDFSSI